MRRDETVLYAGTSQCLVGRKAFASTRPDGIVGHKACAFTRPDGIAPWGGTLLCIRGSRRSVQHGNDGLARYSPIEAHAWPRLLQCKVWSKSAAFSTTSHWCGWPGRRLTGRSDSCRIHFTCFAMEHTNTRSVETVLPVPGHDKPSRP